MRRVNGLVDVIYQNLRPLLTMQVIKKLDLGVATKQVLTIFSELFGVEEYWYQYVLSGRLAL